MKLSSTKIAEGSGHPLEDWIAQKVANASRKEPELRRSKQTFSFQFLF